MNVFRLLAIVLFLVLNISCTPPANAQQSITNIRIEYIGETDKAPPIIIIGMEKSKNILPWEHFYQGTELMLTSIKNNCIKDLWAKSISTQSILRITIYRSKKNSVCYFNNKASINSFLNCIIHLINKKDDFHWLLIDLKSVLNTVAAYN